MIEIFYYTIKPFRPNGRTSPPNGRTLPPNGRTLPPNERTLLPNERTLLPNERTLPHNGGNLLLYNILFYSPKNNHHYN